MQLEKGLHFLAPSKLVFKWYMSRIHLIVYNFFSVSNYTACLTVQTLRQVDPKTTESLRGASVIMTEKEAKLAKEYQALKDRNQLMEAQLESMRYCVRPTGECWSGIVLLF